MRFQHTLSNGASSRNRGAIVVKYTIQLTGENPISSVDMCTAIGSIYWGLGPQSSFARFRHNPPSTNIATLTIHP
jgi:hypothetical protein